MFHANGGLLKLEDFSIAKGDTLTVDKAMQGSMQQASDGRAARCSASAPAPWRRHPRNGGNADHQRPMGLTRA